MYSLSVCFFLRPIDTKLFFFQTKLPLLPNPSETGEAIAHRKESACGRLKGMALFSVTCICPSHSSYHAIQCRVKVFFLHTDGMELMKTKPFPVLSFVFFSTARIELNRMDRQRPTLFDGEGPLFGNHGVAGRRIVEN